MPKTVFCAPVNVTYLRRRKFARPRRCIYLFRAQWPDCEQYHTVLARKDCLTECCLSTMNSEDIIVSHGEKYILVGMVTVSEFRAILFSWLFELPVTLQFHLRIEFYTLWCSQCSLAIRSISGLDDHFFYILLTTITG